jgi:hypothetical protein
VASVVGRVLDLFAQPPNRSRSHVDLSSIRSVETWVSFVDTGAEVFIVSQSGLADPILAPPAFR